MIKQTLYINTSRFAGKAKHSNQPDNRLTVFQGLTAFSNKAIRAMYQLLKSNIVKLVTVDGEGHETMIDVLSPEGSFFSRYNFLGTPHTLYMRPVNATPTQKAMLPLTVTVKPLEENCYELIVEGKKPGKEKLGIKIYDDTHSLVFSEQVTYSGKFTRLYDLKWPQLADVSFEVTSRYGVHKTGTV